MKVTSVLTPLAVAVAAMLGAQTASADYTKDTVILRVGASYVNPLSDQMTFADDSFFFPSITRVDAFRATVDPDEEWGWNLSGVWLPIEHWGVELNYINGDDHVGGSARGFFDVRFQDGIQAARLGKFEPDMTNLFVNWFPLDPSCMVQPYIGVGLNYTDYGDEKFTLFRGIDTEFDNFNLRGDFDLGHSWGFAWQVGVDFVFGRDSAWLVNAAAIYIDAETEMGFRIFEDFDGVGAPLDETLVGYSGDYRYNPWVFNLGIGYKFSF